MAQLPRLTARRAGVLPSEDAGQEPTSTHTPCAGWMSINDYYEVTRVTPSGKTAYIRPLRKTYAGSPNDMSGCRAYPMVAGEGRFSGDEEAVLAIRDNWEVADFDACEWSDPNAADPYICVVYDLRRLAEDEDGKPRRMKGTIRYDTHYSLSGFDYLTFPDA